MNSKIHCPSCGCGLRLCPHCSAPVGEGWAFCPSCAGSLTPTTPAVQAEPKPKAKARPAAKKGKKRTKKLKDTVHVYVSTDEHRWLKDAATEAGTSATSYLEELLQVASINQIDTEGELPERIGKKPFPLKLPKERTREWFAAEAAKNNLSHVARYVVRQAMARQEGI